MFSRIFGKKAGKDLPAGKISYDPERKTPVIHCSICNGERVGGLKDIETGRFEEIMLIRTDAELALFKEMVGREDIPKEY